MNSYEQKYGIKEDESIKQFHRNRRMFAIHQNNLWIAEPNLPYSHAVWFEKLGWITPENDDLMNSTTRGAVYLNGDVYFYVGYDFQITSEAENEFFEHLPELVERLNLSPRAKIFGGKIKQATRPWPVRKEYGQVDNFLV